MSRCLKVSLVVEFEEDHPGSIMQRHYMASVLAVDRDIMAVSKTEDRRHLERACIHTVLKSRHVVNRSDRI